MEADRNFRLQFEALTDFRKESVEKKRTFRPHNMGRQGRSFD